VLNYCAFFFQKNSIFNTKSKFSFKLSKKLPAFPLYGIDRVFEGSFNDFALDLGGAEICHNILFDGKYAFFHYICTLKNKFI
jgi:hypothetical protein